MFPQQGDACLMCREVWWAVSKPPGAGAGIGWAIFRGMDTFLGSSSGQRTCA